MTWQQRISRHSLVEGENLSLRQASVSPFLEVDLGGVGRRLWGWGCWKLRSRSCWTVQRRLGK